MDPAYAASLAPTAAQPGALQAAPVQAAYAQAYPQAQGYAPQGLVAAQQAPAAAPVVIRETVIKEVPAKPVVHRQVVHHTRYVRDDGYVAQAPRPAPQPNFYVRDTGGIEPSFDVVNRVTGRTMAVFFKGNRVDRAAAEAYAKRMNEEASA